MQVIYEDKRILVAVKPAGVVSVDEPGGMPSLVRAYLGDDRACVRTVHRLDQTVSGLMVLARSRAAASILSEQIRNGGFHKAYLAAVHGCPDRPEGRLQDLLYYDRQLRRSCVMAEPGRDVLPAALQYRVLAQTEDTSLLKIRLETGRTHQIRVQLSSRGWPILGDRKYGPEDGTACIALWSCELRFAHPESGEPLRFSLRPPEQAPWTAFPEQAFDELTASGRRD